MFKYIYVFILIVILFGIKWKLQKKYEFKEEFSTNPATTLTDMFNSSSDFYNNLNIINSNIKFDSNLSWNLDTSETIWFQHSNNQLNRIELFPPKQGIVIGDNIHNTSHSKVLTSVTNNILSFQLINFSIPTSLSIPTSTNKFAFAKFFINSNNTSNINESLSNLKSWHKPISTYKGYSVEPFNATVNMQNFIIMENSLTVDECYTLCENDDNCVGFSIENNTPGSCIRWKNDITLDSSKNDRTTYIKPT